jgi:electron transport complex protein RnfB
MLTVAVISFVLMGVLAVVFGIGLAIAARVFAIESDPRIDQIIEHLAGANCGACGRSGCAALAEAIAKGDSPVDACPVATALSIARISQIMGVAVAERVRRVAIVRCKGCALTGDVERYDGPQDCRAAFLLTGGVLKNCYYACFGLGTCAEACPFDAIVMREGVPHIVEPRCTGCGKCIAACPKNIIELRPIDKHVHVQCLSLDPGRLTGKLCPVGCMACKRCEKACKQEAIKVIDNLARIDYNKCENCGPCVAACPKKVIANFAKARKAGALIPQAEAEYGKREKEEAAAAAV